MEKLKKLLQKPILLQNCLRLIIAILVIVMLFLPWCSLRMPVVSQERAEVLLAVGVVALSHEHITEEEFKALADQIAPLLNEKRSLMQGFLPKKEGTDAAITLPFYMQYKEQEDSFSSLQNEIGDPDLKWESNFSIPALIIHVKNLIQNGASIIKPLWLSNIKAANELDGVEDYEERQALQEQRIMNIQRSGLSAEAIASLQLMGIDNSEVWVELGTIDTSGFNASTIKTLLFLVGITSSPRGFISVIWAFSFMIVLWGLAFDELKALLKLKKTKDLEKKSSDRKFFTYLGVFISAMILTFFVNGTRMTPIFFVVVGLTLVAYGLYRFLGKKNKQSKRAKVFTIAMCAVNAICLALAFTMVSSITQFDAFGITVTKEAYDQAFEEETAKYQDDLAKIDQDVRNGELSEFDAIEKRAEINKTIKIESVSSVVATMQIAKIALGICFFIVLWYASSVLMRTVDLLQDGALGKIDSKFIRHIIPLALLIFMSTVDIALPFIAPFIVLIVIEVAVMFYKKFANGNLYDQATCKGALLVKEGIILEEKWVAIEQSLSATGATDASVQVNALNVLFEKYEKRELTADELKQQLGTIM